MRSGRFGLRYGTPSGSGNYIRFGLRIETGATRTTIVDIFDIIQQVQDTGIHIHPPPFLPLQFPKGASTRLIFSKVSIVHCRGFIFFSELSISTPSQVCPRQLSRIFGAVRAWFKKSAELFGSSASYFVIVYFLLCSLHFILF